MVKYDMMSYYYLYLTSSNILKISFHVIFSEINVERKRKIHVENSFDLAKMANSQVDDPLIRELLAKESKFRMLLNSTKTPVYNSLEQALANKVLFDGPMDKFENCPLGNGKILSYS